MKKFLISFILIFFITTIARAEEQSEIMLKGINRYKEANYLGTIQIMEKIINDNPGSTLAYYYKAISYAQIGDINKAEESYSNVIQLDPNSQLASLAKKGLKLLQPQVEVKPVSMEKPPILSEKINTSSKDPDFLTDDVKEDITKRKLDFIIERINNKKELKPSDFNEFEDFSPNKTYKGTPSSEEIAYAYQILAKAGINPHQNQTSGMNPEMMQISMLNSTLNGTNGNNSTGVNNGNNMMNMMPFLMMMQTQQGENNNIDPDFMQAMLSNMMMPDMTGFYNNNNY